MTTATTEAPEVKKAAAGTKLTLPLAQLRKALATVAPAVQRKTTIPVLGSVRIEQSNTALEFAATDLDLAIRVRIATPDAKAQEPFLLPALKLESFAKLLQGDDVSLHCGEARVTLKCGRSVTKLPMLAISNFPQIKLNDVGTGIELGQGLAERVFTYTTFAISAEEARYTLNGALLEIGNGKLAMIATDGHRLARYTAACDTALTASMLLPAGMLRAMHKVIDPGSKALALLETSEYSIFINIEDSTGGIALAHRRMTGTFPNYKAIMPTAAVACVTVRAAEMAAALRRCGMFADERSGAVKLTIMPYEVRLRAASVDTGETDEAIDVRLTGETFAEFAVGFNGDYLLDAFSRLTGDVQVRFATTNGQTAVLIYAEPAPGETFEYVVMPMRV
jgi:DNA polymerase-3 subunit beta